MTSKAPLTPHLKRVRILRKTLKVIVVVIPTILVVCPLEIAAWGFDQVSRLIQKVSDSIHDPLMGYNDRLMEKWNQMVIEEYGCSTKEELFARWHEMESEYMEKP